MYILPMGWWILLSHLLNTIIKSFRKSYHFCGETAVSLCPSYMNYVKRSLYTTLFLLNQIQIYKGWQTSFTHRPHQMILPRQNVFIKNLSIKQVHGISQEK